MSPKNNWFVITGAPSTGKTTVLKELSKLGYKTMPEAARMYIDEAFGRGLTIKDIRSDERQFQIEVVRLKQHIEKEASSQERIFFDRAMHDTLAYMQFYGYEIEPWVEDLFKESVYKKVFLFEPIGQLERDYARTEDESFVDEIHRLLFNAYKGYGMEPIIVGSGSVEERVKFVLSNIESEQSS